MAGNGPVKVGDVKQLLALILDDGKDDEETISYVKAKNMIDLVTGGNPLAGQIQADGVLMDGDNTRMENLGLGRGVDATDPYPWQNKSSFQVRKITDDCSNIIGTEESGMREYYEEDISSVLSLHMNSKFTIEEPSNSLNIGIDAELSRSFAETRKAVGEKVVTRTVSFRTNSDWAIPNKAGSCPQPAPTFEEQLSKWILDRIETKTKWKEGNDPSEGDKKKVSGLAVDMLSHYIKTCGEQSTDLVAILQYCYDFVEHLGITHYVHSIQLGAAKYEVLTSSEYHTKLDGEAGFGINKVAKAELRTEAGLVRHRRHNSKKVNTIGRIDEKGGIYTVEKVSPNEAVLKVELKPLHLLVQTRALYLALQWALTRYIERREDRREGPFLISCGPAREPIYWKVSENYEVGGTTDCTDASLFYVLPTDNGKHAQEFTIGYVGEEMAALARPKGAADPLSKLQALAPAPRYLTANLSFFGRSEGPLEVSAGAYGDEARFSLHSSVLKKYAFMRRSVDSSRWAEGEGFFINCTRRRLRLDSYIAMMKEDRQGGTTYRTMCLLSVKNHQEDRGPWMVFRLLPGEHKKLPNVHSPAKKLTKAEYFSKPVVDADENDPTYRSDHHDFSYLYGDPTHPKVRANH